MKKSIEYLILDTIKRKSSVMSLYKAGYSYLKVIEWCNTLEQEGKININDDGYREITPIGKKCLDELKNENNYKQFFTILPYSQYKITQLNIEEIYLP